MSLLRRALNGRPETWGLAWGSSEHQLPATVAPSVLACDFGRMAEESLRVMAAGSDMLHMDVMDGHFVPNISFGPPVVASLRKHTDAFLDCHIMVCPFVRRLSGHAAAQVSDPGMWIEPLAQAGASHITFHIEAVACIEAAREIVARVRSAGMRVGISLKPATPASAVSGLLEEVDMVLVMTVEPGFGGQSFMEDMMPKVRELRRLHPSLTIQVDGGLSASTVDMASAAGANSIVAGTYLFKAPDVQAAVERLRTSVLNHRP